MGYGAFGSSLRDLPRARRHTHRRESSWDRTGGNQDCRRVPPGQTLVLADIAGAGSVNHLWMTLATDRTLRGQPGTPYLRGVVLRAFWDGSPDPSVLTPVGDFFGSGHAQATNFVSAPLQMSPQGGRALNSWWHMPFADGARLEIVNEHDEEVAVYYYVDYDVFDGLEDDVLRFHAHWRRENPTQGVEDTGMDNLDWITGGTNLDGAGNYVILETTGRGHYVGCVLSTTNLRHTSAWNWYGEGDDMIFVDGEPFPPSLHGTGTEDYFNTAWCPSEAYHAPYHGLTQAGHANWGGQFSQYRFHIEDPVPFRESIRVTIEHGHANRRSDDLSSVAYWYQQGSAAGLGLPGPQQRVPRLA